MKNDDRNPELCRAFVDKAKDILSQHPEIKHSWSIDEDEDHCILDIPKQSDNGFDVTVEVFPHEITVSADGPHFHFDDINNIEETIQSTLGLVRDMLSPSMRVVEHRSSGKPYKWHIESCRNGQWHREDSIALFFFNYFGKRTTNIYQNHILQSRI